ncbi:DUF3291 domain-containing protein [Aggregatimonas sangjinii]|uniref:DUF3291 domain-containing protein n=1 Tax=Aggregatimonas sangjinii TaxID=2583587 RepID=A0A5B7SLR9_9FLAO|nr:DUF3291 domain-containing protein [Aggregatimonas sangjinii]QCW99386.1 DUF3291 domain-containing protein [Aggregatimonas sangjinii]
MEQPHYLSQVNIARMIAPIDSPMMADFVDNLDRINEIAEKHQGFVWRLKGEQNDATAMRVFEDDFLIINMSVWKSMDALFKFTYSSEHVAILKRKKEWFSAMKDMHMAFWYLPLGHLPTPDEAKARLQYLNQNGETPYAFTFKSKYTSEDALHFNPEI